MSRNLWLITAFHAAWNVGVQFTSEWLLTVQATPRSPIIFNLSGTDRVWLGIGVSLLAIVGLQLLLKRRIAWGDIARALQSHNPRFRRVGLAAPTNSVG